MHKGIVHNDGSGQGLADGPRIGEMYIFPHVWQNIRNRLSNRWIVPVRSVTFENPPVEGHDTFPGFTRVRTTITHRTTDDVPEGAAPDNQVHRVRLVKYQFKKGEVYKIPHAWEGRLRGANHIGADEMRELRNTLVEVLAYRDATRTPILVKLILAVVLICVIAFFMLKAVNKMGG